MALTFTIQGRLDGLNEYTKANRSNQYAGASMKGQNEKICMIYIKNQLRNAKIKNPCHLTFKWYEKNRRRDCDNIAFAKKFIQDALVKSGVLIDDSQKYITGFTDYFFVDKGNPRIEVEICETE